MLEFVIVLFGFFFSFGCYSSTFSSSISIVSLVFYLSSNPGQFLCLHVQMEQYLGWTDKHPKIYCIYLWDTKFRHCTSSNFSLAICTTISLCVLSFWTYCSQNFNLGLRYFILLQKGEFDHSLFHQFWYCKEWWKPLKQKHV